MILPSNLPLPRLLLALLVMLLVAQTAHANDPATRAAKRHFERGEKLFALGKFDEALDEYQNAYDAKPIPDFLFNVGQCYRNLGAYEEAVFSYKKFLKLEPEAPNRAEVERLIEDLEARQEKDAARRFGFERPPEPPPRAEASAPIYKKWWFWSGIAVVGAASGAGIYAATRGGPPSTSLGNIVFGK